MSYELGADSDRHSELFGEAREEEARPRFRGWIASLIVLLVLGAFAGGLWFAYQQGLRHASGGNGVDVPLIRADERPTKVKPENPGGMEVPDRDKLIYTQKHPLVEHLLPPPEKPLPRPTAAPSNPARPSAESVPAPAPAAVEPGQPQQLTSKPVEQLLAAPPTGARPPVSRGEPANLRGTRLQLGSVRSEETARQEWERIKRTNADLLASISATPTRADLGEKGVFYRIQTGPLADADHICSELKRRNVGCIIVR